MRIRAFVIGVAATSGAIFVAAQIASAFQSPPQVKVCSLLPASEVKRIIGGSKTFDMFPPEEEAVAGGSSCNYAGVLVQVIPFSQGTIDAARKTRSLEAISGVGDEAYLYDNRGNYAELYVKVGPRLLTLQRDIGMGQTIASVRPQVMELAKALVAKLR